MATSGKLSFAAVWLLVLCIGNGGVLFAADAAEPPAPAAPEERPAVEKAVDKLGEKLGGKIDETIGTENVEKIDEAHQDQAQFIGLFFENIDRAFGEEYVEDRDRKIQVRAGLETTFNNHGTSVDTAVKIGLRVPLPALKRRFNLFIDLGEDLDELGAVSSPNFSESEKAFSLAASLLRRVRNNLEAGIKLRLFRSSEALVTVYPFLRFEENVDAMRYFVEQRVIWESDNTWHTLTAIDIDRKFGSRIFLRLRNRIDYTFGDPGASIAHGLITRRSVFEDNGLSFELWLEYNTAKDDDPLTMTDDTLVYAQLRLRGRIWRNWLQYELRPVYTIPTNTDRNAFFSFFVSLTVIWDSFLGGGDTPNSDQ